MPRIMALDVGTKTIGVAATDPLAMFSQPICTIARKGVAKDTLALLELFKKWEPTLVVVGMPYELDGTEERSARLARQIGEAVAEATGLPVEYMDERFTSVMAERSLIRADMSRAKRKKVIDQAAAMEILDSWLAQRPRP